MHPRRPIDRRTDPARLSARSFPFFFVVSLMLHGALAGGLAAYGWRHVAAAGGEPERVKPPEEPETLALDLRTYRDSTLVVAPEPPMTIVDAPAPEPAFDAFEPELADADPSLDEPLSSMVVASSTPPVQGERAPEVSWIGLGSTSFPRIPPRNPATAAVGEGDGEGDAGSADGADVPVGGAGEGEPDGEGQRPTGPPVADTGAGFLAGAAPLYPKLSQRLGEEGSVVLRLTVDATGAVIEASVETSSGFPRLDEAAVVAVKRWRFRPAIRGGVAIATTFLHTVTFRLVE
jgi:periplasmic protein TonB